MSDLSKYLVLLGAGLCLAGSISAHAQSLPYGDVSEASDEEGGGDEDTAAGAGKRAGKKVHVSPYIEAQQVVQAELSPGDQVLTWTSLAAGIDAGVSGRNTQASLSVRYERRFGWDNNVSDADVLSGVARASANLVPRVLTIEAGAMATRASIEGNGSTVGGLEFSDSATQIYSIYAGPTLQTHMGDVAVEGHYRLGYSRIDSPDAVMLAPGQPAFDIFDEAVVHNAAIHIGTKPGEPLPVGVGYGAGWNREDVSNLDQRVDDRHLRLDLTLPVGGDLALVGGVGYERVEISSRDALIDTNTGLPVIGSDGRYVTDKSQPRRIAYESDGMIWDAGVMWRPSRRTSLEAHVGRRYDSTSYYGSFAYAPNRNTSVNLSVYDNVSGFGGMIGDALARMPAQFETIRSPFNGVLGGCVAATGTVTQGQATCLNGALASVRSAVFRGRGIMASIGITSGKLQYGFGAGYDRRKFIAASGTVLASANGLVDENAWVAAYLNGRIDRNSGFSANARANWYQSGDALAGDVSALGATLAYYRSITSKLSASAAVGIDGVSRDLLEDYWAARGLIGLRYSF
jgi:hypothetical protein